jgi:hypothetical protein
MSEVVISDDMVMGFINGSPKVALLKGVFDNLKLQSEWQVFNNVPSGSEYPYIVIGDDTFDADNTDSFKGFSVTSTVHTWSDKRSDLEIRQMQDYIFNTFNSENLSISGYNLVNCYEEYSETFLDPDGITRHGVQRFRINFDKS